MTSIRPRGATALLLVLASGCKGCESEEVLPTLLEAEDATPVGVWVADGLGTAPITLPVYAVNGLGAPVAAGDIALTSDGTVPGAVTPGADGWAEAEVTAADAGRYAVSGSVAGVSGDGAAWVLDGVPGRIDARATPLPAEPTAVAQAGDGVAAAVGGDVWWTGFDGRAPARVLALPEPVVGLFSTEIDADGVSDLVVTSGARVVVLRGRNGGGLAWGGGWSAADGRTVVAAAIDDFDGDNNNDLAVALDDGGLTALSVMAGDGAWGFAAIDALELDYAVFALSIDDLDGNGIGEITVLTEDGLLRRYTRIDGDWANTLSGTEFDLETGAGATLLPSVDLDGDDVPDLVAYGPAVDGTGWLAWIVTAGSADPAQYPIVGATADYPWLGVATGDLSGDGVADFVYTAPGKVARGWWGESSSTPGTYTFQIAAWQDAPGHAAVAITDVDGDLAADVVVGGSSLRVMPGMHDDPATTDVVELWKFAASTSDVFGLDLLLPPVAGDVTGDGIVDLVGAVLVNDVSGVAVEGVLGVPATDTTAETLRSGGALTLATSGQALDIAVCGTRAYVLYADDTDTTGNWLARVNLGAGMGPVLDGAKVLVQGDRLACGAFTLGEVAVADPTGAVSYVDAAGAVTAGDSIGAVGDLVAVDSDGDGLDELVACAEAGCVAVAADLDGDGATDLAVQDSTGIVVTIGGASVTLDATGVLTAADANGDGVTDLVIGEDGLARVVHALDGQLSPPVASWTWRPVEDGVLFGDLDGDGVPDAFYVGEDRYPETTDGDDWEGALVYAHSTAE